MKKLMIVPVLALLSVGCASTTASKTDSTLEVDWERVAVIEAANRKGAAASRVIWVNPPLKRSEENRETDTQGPPR